MTQGQDALNVCSAVPAPSIQSGPIRRNSEYMDLEKLLERCFCWLLWKRKGALCMQFNSCNARRRTRRWHTLVVRE